MKLLLVHGRAQEGKSSEAIETEWMSALKRGADDSGIALPNWSWVVPFYGDDLKKIVDDYDLPLAENLETRGGAIEDDYNEFLADVAVEAHAKNKVSEAQVDAEIGEGPETRGPENWKWVQAVIRAIDRRTPEISGAGIGLTLRDVFLYVNYGSVRRKINAIVADKLTDERTVVIGHSLGSVVAYCVLRERGASDVARLVTVGSPLGIRAIRDRLQTPLTMPNGVQDWFNARDSRDVVALYPLDRTNFDIDPAVRNDSDVINHTNNRHGIDGYLDDANVAKEICNSF